VLSAMREIPRHIFIPPPYNRSAYEDCPLPIGHSQTISQPYIVAVMTELLIPKPSDNILEIGSGCGYQAAVLGKLANKVTTIERLPDIAELARKNLVAIGTGNIEVITGDGTEGYPPNAPYEGIIITAATPRIPPPLVEQLAEGGRLIAPVGSRSIQELVRLTKTAGTIVSEKHGGVRFVPLIGHYGWEGEES
jgi:protein-L-isoaspartate(D-aspartate) O-methyltransferase